MPKKITRITTEQQGRFPEWVDKWTAIGLSTEPADFEKATEAALKAYDMCCLARPQIVLHVGSPYAAVVAGALSWKMLKTMKVEVRKEPESLLYVALNKLLTKEVAKQKNRTSDFSVDRQALEQVGMKVSEEATVPVREAIEAQLAEDITGQPASAVFVRVQDETVSTVQGEEYNTVDMPIDISISEAIHVEAIQDVRDAVMGQLLSDCRNPDFSLAIRIWHSLLAQMPQQIAVGVVAKMSKTNKSFIASQQENEFRKVLNEAHISLKGIIGVSSATAGKVQAAANFIRDAIHDQLRADVRKNMDARNTLQEAVGKEMWETITKSMQEKAIIGTFLNVDVPIGRADVPIALQLREDVQSSVKRIMEDERREAAKQLTNTVNDPAYDQIFFKVQAPIITNSDTVRVLVSDQLKEDIATKLSEKVESKVEGRIEKASELEVAQGFYDTINPVSDPVSLYHEVNAASAHAHNVIYQALQADIRSWTRGKVEREVADRTAFAVRRSAIDIRALIADALKDAVGSGVRDGTFAQLRYPVLQGVSNAGDVNDERRNVYWGVRSIVEEAAVDVHGAVSSQLSEDLAKKVKETLWKKVLDEMSDTVGTTVPGLTAYNETLTHLYTTIDSQLWKDTIEGGKLFTDAVNNCRGGQFLAPWCAYVSFLRDVMQWENDSLERFAIDEQLTLNSGWVWWHENVVAISDRPREIHRDDRGRLHNETGPAVRYADGWSVFAVHGVRVPESIIMRPESITVKQIRDEGNAEVRRIMVEKYGMDRYLVDAGAKVIHSDKFGTLYSLEQEGDEPIIAVKVIDATEEDGEFRQYFLRVDPRLRPLPPGHWTDEAKREWLNRQQPQEMTAKNAVASTWGLRGEKYIPVFES